MSLDKSIEHGKEHRKPYTGGKSIAKSCRNHGGCDWCRENRMYHTLKEYERTKAEELEERGVRGEQWHGSY